MMNYPKISIVTVVYNNQNHIKKTLESVISQNYENIEYVIVDAGSTDKTLEIIEIYKNNIDVLISESDKGIYDGMNKGIRLASGDFVLFLNSGDIFYNNDIVRKLSDYVKKFKLIDIIYGDVGIASDNFNFIPIVKSKPITSITKGMVANHQSCLINRDIHHKYNYDLKYKLASDYHFFLRCYLNSAVIIQVPVIISIISDGGVSDVNRLSVFREKLVIKNELNYSVKNYLDFYLESIYMFSISFFKKILPSTKLAKFYKFKYKNNINY